MNFWRTVEILGKRKWLIAVCVLATCALTLFATRLAGSKWVATVPFMVPQTSPLVRTAAGNNASTDDNEGQTTAQASKAQIALFTAIVKSRSVIEPVLKQLNLPQMADELPGAIEIEATSPRLFQLHVTDNSSLRVESLANQIADEFATQCGALNADQAKKVVSFLQEQIGANNKKRDEARQRYDKYRRDHQVLGSPSNNLDMALSRLKGIRDQRDQATSLLAEAKARLAKMEAQPTDSPDTPAAATSLPGFNSSPTPTPTTQANADNQADTPEVAQLKKELEEVEARLQSLRDRYTELWPDVIKTKAVRDAIKTRLDEQKAKAAPAVALMSSPPDMRKMRRGELEVEVAGLQARLSTLNASYNSCLADLDKLKGTDTPLTGLLSELNQLDEVRSGLLTRLNAAQMALDVTLRQNPIIIMDRVSHFNPPIDSGAGKTKKLLILAGIAALLCSSGLMIALDSIDRRLRTVREAEVILPAPVVAVVPQPASGMTYATLARATELHPKSLQSEAYRFLGLHLLNRPSLEVRSVMMISAKAEQGCTTALTNLGITLAQAGKRVILVDANIRTAELHQVFDLPNDFGFTDLMQDPTEATLDQALHSTAVDNLSVITSGPQPSNPWKLFRSSQLATLSRQLHERADYVLYDTPSALMFTDAHNLASVVDGAYLCVRALEPLTGTEERMVEMLNETNVTVLGAVLTDVPSSLIEGYSNYQHYYEPNESEMPPLAGPVDDEAPAMPAGYPWIDVPGSSSPSDLDIDDI